MLMQICVVYLGRAGCSTAVDDDDVKSFPAKSTHVWVLAKLLFLAPNVAAPYSFHDTQLADVKLQRLQPFALNREQSN